MHVTGPKSVFRSDLQVPADAAGSDWLYARGQGSPMLRLCRSRELLPPNCCRGQERLPSGPPTRDFKPGLRKTKIRVLLATLLVKAKGPGTEC